MRLRSGAAGVHGAPAASRWIWLKWPSTRLGSYVGCEAQTSTCPVFGSSATAPPHWPARACCAVRCAFASMRRDDVVAALGDPAELVERVVEEGVEVRVRAGEIVVHRLLEPGARALDRRVPDGARGELVRRIGAEVPGASELLLPHLLVPREGGLPVRGEDRAAVDRELLDDQLRVPLPRLEVGRLPEPVRRHHDERDEEADEDEEERCGPARSRALSVHAVGDHEEQARGSRSSRRCSTRRRRRRGG